MKRFVTLMLLFAFVFAMPAVAQKGGKPFSGTITYSISYDGSWDAATLAMQPKEATVIMNDIKSKSVFLTNGVSVSVISNTIDSSVTTLINAMGMKFFVKQTKDYIISSMEDEKHPIIYGSDEKKTIAGYECLKAEYITLDEYDEEMTTIVYYTKALGTPAMNWGGQFHGLDGFPMEYMVQTDEGTITFTATEVKSKKVKDIEFMIPTDYTEMSPEEFKSLGG
jgi:GLPGLI family protein